MALGNGQGFGIFVGVLRNVTTDLGEVGENARRIPGEVGHVIANVEILLGTNGAGHIEDLIDAVAEAIDVFRFFGGVRPDENVTLHVLRHIEPKHGEQGGGVVDEGDEAVHRFARLGGREVLPLLRETDHERNVHPGIGEQSLVTWHSGTVVRVEENDGVVGEAVFLEFCKALPDLLVHCRDAVVESGHRFANDGCIRVVGRNGGCVRIVNKVFSNGGLDVFLERLIRPDRGAGLV